MYIFNLLQKKKVTDLAIGPTSKTPSSLALTPILNSTPMYLVAFASVV